MPDKGKVVVCFRPQGNLTATRQFRGIHKLKYTINPFA